MDLLASLVVDGAGTYHFVVQSFLFISMDAMIDGNDLAVKLVVLVKPLDFVFIDVLVSLYVVSVL